MQTRPQESDRKAKIAAKKTQLKEEMAIAVGDKQSFNPKGDACVTASDRPREIFLA